jgi:hypothetical protein
MTHPAPMLVPAMKSWVDHVFVPALVRQYIHEHDVAGTAGATSGKEASDAASSPASQSTLGRAGENTRIYHEDKKHVESSSGA